MSEPLERIRARLRLDGLQAEGALRRNPSFRRLLAAQFSALAVIYGLALAGVVLIEEQTHSSAQTGLAIVSSILPAFLGSLIAGAVVDRWGRVRGLLVSHAARALAALAFWVGSQWLPPGWTPALVYAVSATVALFSQFAMTAELALLPDLAGQEHLIPANTLYQFSMLLAEGLGVVLLSPLVIKLSGVPAVGLLGALLCLLALGLVATLPREQAPAAPRGDREPGWAQFGADLQAGWRVIAGDGLLRLVVLQATLAAAVLLVLLSLAPGLISRHLGLQAEDATFVVLPGGVGFALGAFLVNRWEARLRRQGWIAAGLILVGASIGGLAAILGGEGWLQFLLFQALVLILGLALAAVIIPARTVLEERPPAEMRGRVIAAQLALGNAAAVIPLLLGGSLADRWGIQAVLGLLALLALGAGLTGLRLRSNGRAGPH